MNSIVHIQPVSTNKGVFTVYNCIFFHSLQKWHIDNFTLPKPPWIQKQNKQKRKQSVCVWSFILCDLFTPAKIKPSAQLQQHKVSNTQSYTWLTACSVVSLIHTLNSGLMQHPTQNMTWWDRHSCYKASSKLVKGVYTTVTHCCPQNL